MFEKFKAAPLSSGFMVVALLGMIIVMVYTPGSISYDWGFTLGFFFFLMIIASFISMTKAPVEAELYLDHMEHYGKKEKARKQMKARVVKSREGIKPFKKLVLKTLSPKRKASNPSKKSSKKSSRTKKASKKKK